MIRKLILMLSVTALLGGLAAAPAGANGTETGVAAIVGQVDITEDSCSTGGVKGHQGANGTYVDFVDLLMAGNLGNLVGTITANNTIRACVVADVPVEGVPVVGHGEIEAPGAPGDFSGTDLTDPTKCLTGEFLGGDWEQVGLSAVVKFSVEFSTGPIGSDCSGKSGGRADCIGAFGVVPVGSAGVTQFDPIAGEITCAPGVPTNVPKS